MSFTYEPGTTRGKVRLLIGDTDGESYLFEDAEVDALLALNPNVYAAAALGCRAVAGDKAKQAVVVGLAGVDVDRREIAAHYMELARGYEERARTVPVERVDAFDYEVDAAGVDRSRYTGEE